MKKVICTLLTFLMICLFVVPVLAAQEGPVITMQPQSPTYPEYAVAIYTVKAEGTNLTATWYIDWMGKTYNMSEIGGVMQPWEAFAGETYGARKLDNNTFAFVFEGIEYDLDGGYIWCVIEDGHNDVTSQKTRISVGNPNSPPEIVSIPAQLTVEQGAEAEIRCVAKSTDDSQLSFWWFETNTGKREDIFAVNDGKETSDFLVCDTSKLGTRNYLCQISTSNGGFAYSSLVPVTVVEKKAAAPAPEIQTESLTAAVSGQPYTAQIKCSDPAAEFALYYNPGGKNDFEKTGLTLQKDGTITGTPAAAGSYDFCVCAAGEGGEDYAVYTLTVNESAPQETTPQEATKPSATTPSTAPTVPGTTDAPPATNPQAPQQDNADLPWWVLVLIGVAAAGGGAGVAVILTKKKS